MQIELIDNPIRFHLHGKWSVVENQAYPEVGMRLMHDMWEAIKGSGLETTGINYWVYGDNNRMFVAVELKRPSDSTIFDLEAFEFELERYIRHVHIGPYQELPKKWKDLKSELAARGEMIECPCLEIYGHMYEDPSKLETEILIGVKKRA